MKFGPADAMEPDFQGVPTPSIPGFMAFQPSSDRRIPVLTMTA